MPGAVPRAGGILPWMQELPGAARSDDTALELVGWLRRAGIGLGSLLVLAAVAAPSLASDPGTGVAVPTEPDAPQERVFCTPLGCRRTAPAASWSHAVAFGAAVLGTGWAGRRRRP